MSWTIIFLYILVVIFFLLFIGSIFNLYDDRGNGWITVILYGILFIVTLCTAITTHKSPQAIDVYRGKTSLEITSVNNIPTDTTVVWKNN